MSILTKNGIHYLSGEINQDSIEDAIVFILEANLEKKLEQLTLIINSFGGYVHQAFALVDVIFGSSIPISTLGLGAIGSCGLVIFMSGQKGKRILTPNTQILSHQWSGQAQGKQHELISTIKRNDLVQEKMLRHYMRCTGLSEKTILKELLPPHDIWLTAEEAKKLKICDVIKDWI